MLRLCRDFVVLYVVRARCYFPLFVVAYHISLSNIFSG
jgi:hypothetical protein